MTTPTNQPTGNGNGNGNGNGVTAAPTGAATTGRPPHRRAWVPYALGGALVVVLALLVGAAARAGNSGTSDRVIYVTYRCELQVIPFRDIGDWPFLVIPTEGSVCVDKKTRYYSTGVIVGRWSVRAVVTVRTAAGSRYVVETDRLDVQVGDPWPPR